MPESALRVGKALMGRWLGKGFVRTGTALVIHGWLLLCQLPVFADTISGAAASSLRPVLEELRLDYRRTHDAEVRLVYAASGILVQQILHGAPYRLFFSAAPEYLYPLQRVGRICEGPVVIGKGYLVLYVPKGGAAPLDATLVGLTQATVRHLAIADPLLAPFGGLARQALERAGVWQSLQGRLVFGESAAQAAQMALSGAVDAALLPRHLADSQIFRQRGRWVAVDESLYQPTPFSMVLLCGASEEERTFYLFVRDHLRTRPYATPWQGRGVWPKAEPGQYEKELALQSETCSVSRSGCPILAVSPDL